MASDTDLILNRLATIPDVGHKLGIFVRMDGALAVVNVGDRSVAIPCSGYYPPVVGMAVQLERRLGALIVTGPSAQLNPIGKIKAGGAPKCTVTVDGIDYVLGLRSSYTPVVGDDVEINWTTGIIQGKITATPVAPDTGQNPGGGGGPFSDLVVMAEGSGSYNGGWWTNDVYNGDNNVGAWFYGTRVADALRGTQPTSMEIFLNPRQASGNAPMIGWHGSSTFLGGAVSVAFEVPVEPRSGWVALPVDFAIRLRDFGGGIGVTPSGYTIWRGTQSDGLSGALRFAGTR
ncbi:hypothetical protein [Glaciibacter superstes]|uniref:hypothetical protein n=1 Tax=Glaciibacter superstes TaxID=501023 RepID=UPI0003B669EF|nr:hypothetical protein [Glaciibacter superstes]